MANFLLIHGSGHGAWCFSDLIPKIEALGHSARAIDLPGHGQNPYPLGEITLDLYRDAILSEIQEPLILVGHSMAGFPISAAAEKDPSNITRLVYLCAYAPHHGASLVDMRKEAPRQPLMEAIEKTTDGLGFTVKPEKIRQVFYHDCSDEQIALAGKNLCIQAIKPQATSISLGDNYASVSKTYIRCANDQTIPPEYQTTMTKDWPEQDVYHMDTGHSPFFADPEGLAALLDQISKEN